MLRGPCSRDWKPWCRWEGEEGRLCLILKKLRVPPGHSRRAPGRVVTGNHRRISGLVGAARGRPPPLGWEAGQQALHRSQRRRMARELAMRSPGPGPEALSMQGLGAPCGSTWGGTEQTHGTGAYEPTLTTVPRPGVSVGHQGVMSAQLATSESCRGHWVSPG